MIDPWPTSGHVALGMFFTLVIDDFFCLYLEQWVILYWLVMLICTNSKMDKVYLFFIVEVLSFSYYDWLTSRVYLCFQHLLKSSDPGTRIGFLGCRHSPFMSLQLFIREIAHCMWPQMRKDSEALPGLTVSHQCTFSLLFLLCVYYHNKSQPQVQLAIESCVSKESTNLRQLQVYKNIIL